MNNSVTQRIRQIAEEITGDMTAPINMMRFRAKYGIAELHEYDVAKSFIAHEYKSRHGEELPDEYASYGARYFLMPEKAFRENAKRCDFNAFELAKIYTKIYPSVDVVGIIYHLMYVFNGAMRRYSNGIKLHIFMPSDFTVEDSINIDIERELIKSLSSKSSGRVSGKSRTGKHSALVWAYKVSPEETLILYLPENYKV